MKEKQTNEIKALYKRGKQIRVWLNGVAYEKIKHEAKLYGLEIQQYAGLLLNGCKIVQEVAQ